MASQVSRVPPDLRARLENREAPASQDPSAALENRASAAPPDHQVRFVHACEQKKLEKNSGQALNNYGHFGPNCTNEWAILAG